MFATEYPNEGPSVAALGLHSCLDFGVCFLLHKPWQCKCVELQDLVSRKAAAWCQVMHYSLATHKTVEEREMQ